MFSYVLSPALCSQHGGQKDTLYSALTCGTAPWSVGQLPEVTHIALATKELRTPNSKVFPKNELHMTNLCFWATEVQKYFSTTFIHAINEAMVKTHNTYVVMKGFCFTRVFTCFSSFWGCTVEIPEHTAREEVTGMVRVSLWCSCAFYGIHTPHMDVPIQERLFLSKGWEDSPLRKNLDL